MERHPSQACSFSSPIGVTTGLTRTVKGTAARARSSEAGTSRTATRRPTCTWGPPRPTPSYSCMVSTMSSTRCWNSGDASTSGGTSRAAERTTGWPMRATLRIIGLLVELVAVARGDLDDADGRVPEDLEADDAARGLAPERGVELAQAGDALPVEGEDEIPTRHPRPIRGASLHHARDDDAAVEGLGKEADPGASGAGARVRFHLFAAGQIQAHGDGQTVAADRGQAQGDEPEQPAL